MIEFSHKGNFEKTFRFFEKSEKISRMDILNACGRRGVEALSSATPVDTGNTAGSWYYTISRTGGGYKITWRNSNIHKGQLIAVLLQYGHGTGTGGYVQGRDYINPAIRPIFDLMAQTIGKELNS